MIRVGAPVNAVLAYFFGYGLGVTLFFTMVSIKLLWFLMHGEFKGDPLLQFGILAELVWSLCERSASDLVLYYVNLAKEQSLGFRISESGLGLLCKRGHYLALVFAHGCGGQCCIECFCNVAAGLRDCCNCLALPRHSSIWLL